MKETSRLLALHPRTIQKMDKAGKIRAIRTPSGRRRITEGKTTNELLMIPVLY
nr:MerR family DNA-binding transcriptional regulator [Candidatus Njordarchaeota archaeon]